MSIQHKSRTGHHHVKKSPPMIIKHISIYFYNWSPSYLKKSPRRMLQFGLGSCHGQSGRSQYLSKPVPLYPLLIYPYPHYIYIHIVHIHISISTSISSISIDPFLYWSLLVPWVVRQVAVPVAFFDHRCH